MKREELKKLAIETIDISSRKFYHVDDKEISFNTKDNFAMFEHYPEFKLSEWQKYDKCKVQLHKESTIATIHRVGEGVGVLNFASAKHPGGGFIVGSMAQEECLAYCSDLYVKQWPAGKKQYYDKHNRENNPCYSHTMFIDDVTFFRDKDFNLIEKPTECKVLTSAAVNAGVAKKRGKLEKDINAIMQSRMRKILRVFVLSGCTKIILGAFGCGVFGNSATDVAMLWYELLFLEGYAYCFEEVHFSVIDGATSKNYEAFEQLFT